MEMSEELVCLEAAQLVTFGSMPNMTADATFAAAAACLTCAQALDALRAARRTLQGTRRLVLGEER